MGKDYGNKLDSFLRNHCLVSLNKLQIHIKREKYLVDMMTITFSC